MIQNVRLHFGEIRVREEWMQLPPPAVGVCRVYQGTDIENAVVLEDAVHIRLPEITHDQEFSRTLGVTEKDSIWLGQIDAAIRLVVGLGYSSCLAHDDVP